MNIRMTLTLSRLIITDTVYWAAYMAITACNKIQNVFVNFSFFIKPAET
jgi:hypothetical protein